MNLIKPNEIEQNNSTMIDVREYDEVAAARYSRAKCIPLDRLITEAGKWDPKQEIVIFCQSGARANQGAKQLEHIGFENIKVVDGGINACKSAGVPLVLGSKRIPLQRQVLIGAGIFFMIGLLLAYFVNPMFIAIDYLLALGLIFAGFSGFCPMAIILGKMPWNQTPAIEKNCCSTNTCEGK